MPASFCIKRLVKFKCFDMIPGNYPGYHLCEWKIISIENSVLPTFEFAATASFIGAKIFTETQYGIFEQFERTGMQIDIRNKLALMYGWNIS